MKHPNENGEVQYDSASLYLTAKIHIKARFKRFIANVDGLWWYIRCNKEAFLVGFIMIGLIANIVAWIVVK